MFVRKGGGLTTHQRFHSTRDPIGQVTALCVVIRQNSLLIFREHFGGLVASRGRIPCPLPKSILLQVTILYFALSDVPFALPLAERHVS